MIWTLTLSEDINTRAFLSSNAISTLSDFLSKTPSRKVTRVLVAALKNLASSGNNDVLTEMFASNLEKVLANLTQSAACKNSNDIEFDLDVKNLNDILSKNYRDLSTFDKWSSEVLSGALRWGVVHTEKFWRENCKHVEVNESKLLKALIAVLKESLDPVSDKFTELMEWEILYNYITIANISKTFIFRIDSMQLTRQSKQQLLQYMSQYLFVFRFLFD